MEDLNGILEPSKTWELLTSELLVRTAFDLGNETNPPRPVVQLRFQPLEYREQNEAGGPGGPSREWPGGELALSMDRHGAMLLGIELIQASALSLREMLLAEYLAQNLPLATIGPLIDHLKGEQERYQDCEVSGRPEDLVEFSRALQGRVVEWHTEQELKE